MTQVWLVGAASEEVALHKSVTMSCMVYFRRLTRSSIAHHVGVNACFLLSAGMKLLLKHGFDGPGTAGSTFAIIARVYFGTLHSQRFVHDRASSSNELKVGNGAATRRLVGGRGERAQSRWRGFLEERTYAFGLAKECFHVG